MGIQNFDHSHHKLKIRGLQSPVDVLTFEGREQLSTPFRYDIQFTSTDKAITPELVLMQDGAFSLTAPPVQRLSAQLDALDERKGRYLTGSELKTAVYGIRQSLKEPPLEELLRQLEEQKQTGEVSPTLLTQIDTRLNQLLNRYVILLDTKVEQSQ
ncbi:TPA: hypothetical protein J5G26_003033 [Escherichia coli]|nr:hypothetical protein [Escherichia coli]HBA4000573.1 hypothetical protein [Escherichia coli]HBA4021099.1 hypothetical protein [Escherichia coli]HBA4025913.1 hypothetical protein [Escherichia coli]HBA4030920.1 hypothetical protein [Escherichia coli]